ncbi:hypothetical protein Lal_00031443 [Lupinus albus]|nr:hypothetical protein Lal_00031443 [Lupinus albus]
MNKSSKSLSKIINDQRHSTDRRGLGYAKGPAPKNQNLRATRNLWYMDSGCSKHMTCDKSKLFVLTPRDKGYVTYGDNNKGKFLESVESTSHPQQP